MCLTGCSKSAKYEHTIFQDEIFIRQYRGCSNAQNRALVIHWVFTLDCHQRNKLQNNAIYAGNSTFVCFCFQPHLAVYWWQSMSLQNVLAPSLGSCHSVLHIFSRLIGHCSKAAAVPQRTNLHVTSPIKQSLWVTSTPNACANDFTITTAWRQHKTSS